MLNQLRQGAQGLTSKVLIALLVLSFAVWGIGGFEGYGTGTVATVGDEEVTVQEFATVYDQAQRTAAQAGRRPDAGQVLSQLLSTAAVDDEARRYGLGVSGDRVAQEIAKTPQFRGPGGAFDRGRFEALIMNARMDPDDYIADVKASLIRGQIAESVGAGVEVPHPMVEAIYRLQNEERTISYFVVDEAAITPVGEPRQAELQGYFEENKSRFRAPEYRKIAILTLDPGALVDPAAVSAEELATEYERRKASFEQPERRRVAQIRFADPAAAEAALAKVQGGQAFADAAADAGAAVIDLGLKTRAEFIDPAVADAAFAAVPNTPVAVTENAVEPSLIRVTEVDAGSVTPISEVEDRLRNELATRGSREALNELYDHVEDERAGGSTLKEVAQKLSLSYQVIEAVAQDGTQPDGSRASRISDEALQEAFDSDVSIENSPLRGSGGAWVFLDVLEITDARDRTLDEVRDDAVAAWQAAETEGRIAELADKLFERLKSGVTLAALAAEIGQPVETAEQVKRGASPEGLSANAVAQAFAGPEGHVANADGDGASRVILKVDRAIAPAFFAEAEGAEAIRAQLSTALQRDLLGTFNKQLRDSRTININNAVYQQLTGQLSGQIPPQ